MPIRRRGELSDAQWARRAPLLPPQKPTVGQPAHDHRRIVNGILGKRRTGAPGRDLPARDGPWSTVAGRFRRWRLAGVGDRLFAAVQREEDQAGHGDGTVQFVESPIVRAPQHAAGAKGGAPSRKRSVAAKGASAPRSTSKARAGASRSPCCSRPDRRTKRRSVSTCGARAPASAADGAARVTGRRGSAGTRPTVASASAPPVGGGAGATPSRAAAPNTAAGPATARSTGCGTRWTAPSTAASRSAVWPPATRSGRRGIAPSG